MTNSITQTEIAIVGAGPIGIELAIALQRVGADYLLIEAKQIGDAISQWPPNTHFYSTPEHVALAGIPVHNLDQLPISGERYLAYLRTLVEMNDLNLRLYEPVTGIQRQEEGFVLHSTPLTGPREILARYVVLASGGMAGPRKLNIPGEDLPHVTHYFPGPHAYFRTRLLVVGGRNSALESALRCWRAGAQVSITYRRPALDTDIIKPHLAMDMGDRLRKGEIAFFPSTLPVAITPTHVTLATTTDGRIPGDKRWQHEVDFVLLATGFVADMHLFEMAGVTLIGDAQAPFFNEATMETDVPGLYVAGTAAAGTQTRFKSFISTGHDHVAKIVKALTGHVPQRIGTIPARNNAVTWEEVKAN